MVHVIKLNIDKLEPLPIPDWLGEPVSGEEALRRAKEYDDKMDRLANNLSFKKGEKKRVF